MVDIENNAAEDAAKAAPRDLPEYFDNTEIFEKEIEGLLNKLHALCSEHGIPFVAGACFRNSAETMGCLITCSFPGIRTPVPFRIARDVLNGDTKSLKVIGKLVAAANMLEDVSSMLDEKGE